MRNCSIPLIVCSSLFIGCIPSGTDIESTEKTVQEIFKPTVQPPTRPPLEIDSGILAKREFQEAPILAERVKTGDLTPVSERLPENPLVVVPMEEIRRYGGTL